MPDFNSVRINVKKFGEKTGKEGRRRVKRMEIGTGA
jgi:hypothetical protein